MKPLHRAREEERQRTDAREPLRVDDDDATADEGHGRAAAPDRPSAGRPAEHRLEPAEVPRTTVRILRPQY